VQEVEIPRERLYLTPQAMLQPTTYRAFRRTKDGTRLEITEESMPRSLQPHEVLLRTHSVSLNFRDVAMMHGR